MNSIELQKAEEGIELLATGMGITEKELISIIEDGLFYKYGGKLPESFFEFLDEMKATFDYY